jgi:hypothetical protein
VIKRIGLLVTAAFLVATMAVAGLAGPGFAASPGQEACESGTNPGVWTKTNPGEWTCVRTTTTSGPTPGIGNDPQDTTTTTTDSQSGQGGGEGNQDPPPTTLNCEYNNSGKLFANKSDEGCPDPQPAA